jgi:hypothetical protein
MKLFYTNMLCDDCKNINNTSDMACKGHLECLKYAREHGCPWDPYTTAWAAINDHLECLKYAHEHGCPWANETTKWAAKYGHLECLKYVHENGCPWHMKTTSWAAYYGHLECLIYIYRNTIYYTSEYEHIIKPIINDWLLLVDIAKNERSYVPQDIWFLVGKYW